jgi:hypothetical protein
MEVAKPSIKSAIQQGVALSFEVVHIKFANNEISRPVVLLQMPSRVSKRITACCGAALTKFSSTSAMKRLIKTKFPMMNHMKKKGTTKLAVPPKLSRSTITAVRGWPEVIWNSRRME